MSKSSELDRTVKTFILASITGDGYDVTLTTNKEKAEFLEATFQAEFGRRAIQIGPMPAVEEWLRGLPSALTIPFYNGHILEHAVKWGSLPLDATEKQEDKILDNYWHFMANKVLQIMNGYRVPEMAPEGKAALQSGERAMSERAITEVLIEATERISRQIEEIAYLKLVIERLGSIEAFTLSRVPDMNHPADKELSARIDYARAALQSGEEE